MTNTRTLLLACAALASAALYAPAVEAANPEGWVDGVTAGRIHGWALDRDTPAADVVIHIYADARAGSGGVLVASGVANRPRPDVVAAIGVPGNHGYSISLPAAARAGRPLFAYAVDTSGGYNPMLSGSGLVPAGGASAPPAPSPPATRTPVGPAPARPGAPTAPAPSAGLSRGLRWVRTNPMFISALVTRMPAPPASVVNQYFGRFHANALHLWSDGMGPKLQAWRRLRPNTRFVSWLMKDGRSSSTGSILGGLPPLPGRIGYQLGDEPGSLADLMTYQRGIDLVRASDPGALIIGNFSGSPSDMEQQLDHFATRMRGDVLSYDNYSRRGSSYRDLRRVRAAGLRHGLPYWRYIFGFVSRGSEPSESDMRWDAFVGLTHGYTGHTWFLYQINPNAEGLVPLFFQRAGDWSVPVRLPKLDLAGQINVELANLGRAITQLTSTNVGYVPGFFRKPSAVSKWRSGAGGDPYLKKVRSSGFVDLLVGNFKDSRGEQYVMVQNVNHSGGTWPAKNSKSTKATLTFDFDRSTDPTLDRAAVLRLNRLTGRVEPLALSGSGGKRKLSVRLEAGNPILFKYKTAKPFALR